MVYRVYVEKKAGQTHEADSLLREIQDFLGIHSLTGLRVVNRYDAENIDKALFVSAFAGRCRYYRRDYGDERYLRSADWLHDWYCAFVQH